MTSTNSSLFSTKSYSCNGSEVNQEDDGCQSTRPKSNSSLIFWLTRPKSNSYQFFQGHNASLKSIRSELLPYKFVEKSLFHICDESILRKVHIVNLAVLASRSIVVVEEGGSFTGESVDPRGVTIEPTTEYIYVTDAMNHIVHIFSQTGDRITHFGDEHLMHPWFFNPSG